MSDKKPISKAINYNVFTKRALRGVIRDALAQVAKSGLPGEHHFYIRFDTTRKGVVLPDSLHAAYPKEMTIVLQHRFDDLVANESDFSVTLSFKGHPEHLTIPYTAILDFTDPAAHFRLQFTPVASKTATQDKEPKAKKSTSDKYESSNDSSVLHVDFPRHRPRQGEPNGKTDS